MIYEVKYNFFGSCIPWQEIPVAFKTKDLGEVEYNELKEDIAFEIEHSSHISAVRINPLGRFEGEFIHGDYKTQSRFIEYGWSEHYTRKKEKEEEYKEEEEFIEDLAEKLGIDVTELSQEN